MAEAIGLGASIVGIATAGVTAANALVHFAISYRGSAKKLDDLVSRVTLSATILTEVGNTIVANEQYFKKNDFDKNFGRVLGRCKADYETLREAAFKAGSSTRITTTRLAEDGDGMAANNVNKLSAWKKLAWALGGEDAIKDLQQSLAESTTQVLMMQAAAQMIVLQIMGHQKHGLTDSEQEQLVMLRQDIGLLIKSLRKAGLLSIVSVDIPEQAEPDDRYQSPLQQYTSPKGKASIEGASKVISNIQDEARNTSPIISKENTCSNPVIDAESNKPPPDEGQSGPDKKVAEVLETNSKDFELNLASLEAKETVEDPYLKPADPEPDCHEAWMFHPPQYRQKEKEIRILGITVRVVERDVEQSYHCYGVTISESEIKNLLSKHTENIRDVERAPGALPRNLAWLADKPDSLSMGVGSLILRRHEATKYDRTPRSWTLALLICIPNNQPSSYWRKRNLSSKQQASYLAILRCQAVNGELQISERGHQPLILAMAGKKRYKHHNHKDDEFEIAHKHKRITSDSSLYSISTLSRGRKSRKRGREFFMSQENAETLVNDFLASFSTLYDEIPKEHRRDVLESVPLPTVLEDEQGYDSTSSDSSSLPDSDFRHPLVT